MTGFTQEGLNEIVAGGLNWEEDRIYIVLYEKNRVIFSKLLEGRKLSNSTLYADDVSTFVQDGNLTSISIERLNSPGKEDIVICTIDSNHYLYRGKLDIKWDTEGGVCTFWA